MSPINKDESANYNPSVRGYFDCGYPCLKILNVVLNVLDPSQFSPSGYVC